MLLFLIFQVFVCSEFQKDRSYSVSVKSKYSEVQTLDHILYFLSDFSLNISNRFLSEVLQQPEKTINDAEFLFSTISNLNLLSPVSLSLLKSYIDINYFLPRCEMLRSLAHDIAPDSINLINNDPGFFLASKNRIEKVDNFFLTNLTQPLNFDLNLNEFRDERETIFVYADLKKQKASNFILSIINNQNNDFDNFNIILRPISFTEKLANLRGFGVEMRPYKYLMEYESDNEINQESNNKEQNKEDVTVKGIDSDLSSDYFNYSSIPFFGSKFTNYLASLNRKSDTPELLRDMSNNWPLYLRKISEEEISVSSTKEYEKMSIFSSSTQKQQNQNQKENAGSVFTVSTLNGRVFNVHNFDPFTFVEQIREEQTFSDVLHDEFNITKSDMSFTESFAINDEYLLDYRTKFAVWNKDFERDAEYKDWSTDVKNIFQLKKNIINFAIYMDPSNPLHLTELYTLFLLLEPQKTKNGQSTPVLPMRIGVIPYFNLGSKAARRISFAFAHLALHNQHDAVKFLLHTLAVWKNTEKKNKKESGIKEEYFILAYNYIKGSKTVEWGDLHTLFDIDSKEYNFIKECNKYVKSTGAKLGSIRVNGREVSLDNSFQNLIDQIQEMVFSITKTCNKNNIRDLQNVDVVDLLKNDYLVLQSIDESVLKQRVYGTGVFKMNNRKQKQFVQAIRQVEWKYKDDENPDSYFILFAPQRNSTITEIINETKTEKTEITEEDTNKEIDDNDNNIDDDEDEPENIDEDEDETDDEDKKEEVKEQNVVVKDDVFTLFENFANNEKHKRSTVFAVNPTALKEFLGIKDNETTLLVNGRLYRSFKLETIEQLKLIDFWSEQLVLSYLDAFINKKPIKAEPKQSNKMKTEDGNEEGENEIKNDETEEEIKNIQFDAKMYLSAVAVDWRSNTIQRINVQNIINSVEGLEDCPLYYNSNFDNKEKSNKIEWILIIDPLSRNFQKIADFIYYTNKIRNLVDLQLILVPPQKIENAENDLNSFYRFSFSSDEVTFSMLNDTTSYSTFVDTPQSWLLETLKTSENVDIDNVRLVSPKTNSEASFLLSSIVVEGKCFIDGTNAAKFAEIGLFTKKTLNNNFKSQKVDETTILPMNSYFQFKADPGVYRTSFSTNISSNLYTFDMEFNRQQEFPLFDNIYVDTFSAKEFIIHGKTRYASDSYSHSLQERINRMKTESLSSNKTKSQINIFTISSGKLYERLCKIMFLSVRENTNSIINFYLIKSFLSPSFKASLPEMAKKYSFNYHFVDYKWPSFLYKQKEKQRIIWANKILFLDTLFPSNVDKIIYVDADQIVRTDLQELMNLEISKDGAPYAFVPFCDSRQEIEPYRFWKQGYWRNLLLKDKNDQFSSSYNYHISALFLVDLIKFKEILAGEQLRYSYQQLAPNPENLANLDQDLPNSLQKKVPIYSLSQDWLWCETWCADEDMESAKTIDLCNNPMTKINKIDIAKERVKEWPKLDEEAMKTEEGISSNDYEQFVLQN